MLVVDLIFLRQYTKKTANEHVIIFIIWWMYKKIF